jgi:3',5'-cyclic AMP phosphodiesterase CpdA
MEPTKDTIKFVCVSDTHGLAWKVQVPDGDVLIHAGDFSNSGHPKDVLEFNEWLGTLPHPTKIVIAGNHDVTFDTENYAKKLASRVKYIQSFE